MIPGFVFLRVGIRVRGFHLAFVGFQLCNISRHQKEAKEGPRILGRHMGPCGRSPNYINGGANIFGYGFIRFDMFNMVLYVLICLICFNIWFNICFNIC